MDRTHVTQRLWKRSYRIILFCICALALIGLSLFFFHQRPELYSRINVLIVGDAVVLASWDTNRGDLTLTSFPKDGYIQAIGGYGDYSLESLWKLGFIEKKPTLLSYSIEEAIAVPVPYFLGIANEGISSTALDTETIVRQFFSYQQLLSILGRKVHTNIPLFLYIDLIRLTSRISKDRIYEISLDADAVLQLEELPDGSQRKLIDINKLDLLTEHRFEDERFRREAKSVAIYNTTPTPFLGTRVARLLGSAGAVVITVGNETGDRDACLLKGSKESLKSFTGRFIESHFGCEQEEQADTRADLVVLLGRTYEKRFMPAGR